MNFAYGMGAAVVIIGALFKITHIELDHNWKSNAYYWTCC